MKSGYLVTHPEILEWRISMSREGNHEPDWKRHSGRRLIHAEGITWPDSFAAASNLSKGHVVKSEMEPEQAEREAVLLASFPGLS